MSFKEELKKHLRGKTLRTFSSVLVFQNDI